MKPSFPADDAVPIKLQQVLHITYMLGLFLRSPTQLWHTSLTNTAVTLWECNKRGSQLCFWGISATDCDAILNERFIISIQNSSCVPPSGAVPDGYVVRKMMNESLENDEWIVGKWWMNRWKMMNESLENGDFYCQMMVFFIETWSFVNKTQIQAASHWPGSGWSLARAQSHQRQTQYSFPSYVARALAVHLARYQPLMRWAFHFILTVEYTLDRMVFIDLLKTMDLILDCGGRSGLCRCVWWF